MKTKTVSASDCAYILRRKLGPLRAWPDFLTDCIQGRASISGITLLPTARQHDGRALRPRYAVLDIRVFIETVLARVPGSGHVGIEPTILDIDPSRAWKANRFDREGNPVALTH